MTAPLEVLFVCTANISRSPFMELLARHLADGGLEVSSAGTYGFDEHPMDPEMATQLAARGLSGDAFRSRPLTGDLVDGADLVLTAEVAHRAFILDEQPGAFRKVYTLGQFAAAAESLDGRLAGHDLLAEVGTHRPPADTALDVADPYRRGTEAASAAASQMEELLRVVVPALAPSGRITA